MSSSLSPPPSVSPSQPPADSPATISNPLPPSAPPEMEDNNISPAPLIEIAPFASPPYPPSPETSPAPLPVINPILSPPPEATVITPANSPLPPEPPITPVTSPPPLPSPLPPPLISPSQPATSSPPPLTAPLAPQTSPSPIPSTIILPTPTRPSHPPPFTLTPPTSPSSPSVTLPVSPKKSHTSTGLIVGYVIGGVFLLLLLGFLFISYKDRQRSRRRNRSAAEHFYKLPSLAKDNSKSVLAQHSPQNENEKENGSLSEAYVIPVQNQTFRCPTSSTRRGSRSVILESENLVPPQAPLPHIGVASSSGTFTYDELMVATNGFSDANLLGQGGFGYVHKGFLPSGKEVAVKQLKEGSKQGEREFQAEVDIISRVHHKNLVSLVGYCITRDARLLVYEFVPNNTLEFHLHGSGQPVMEWETRMKIAIGSARGLAYLHEDCNPTIIHRDIKAANILLDHKFEAKVSDFGLAKNFSDASTSITHISTRVVGTFGYLAPEYASSGKVTEKSDVYSYGVMLLELITGRLPIIATESLMNEGLVGWARPLLMQALDNGNFEALVDPRLNTNYNASEMGSMVACAAACVRHSAWLRPRMSQIVRALEGDMPAEDLHGGMNRPGYSALYDPTRSPNSATYQYTNWQYGISGYTGTTSEYGLNPSTSSSDISNSDI